MLPQLRELEERFPDTLVVIGVHSAKFTSEGVTANLRKAVLRHHVRHPVVNDGAHAVWERYAVSAWPTAAFVDPEGRVVGMHAGEFLADDFAQVIEELESEFDRRGLLDRSPLALPLAPEQEPDSTLSFPGKVLADAGRLFIADTGHHRVLVADLAGQVVAAVGRGTPGLEDGDFDTATFRGPQGLAAAGDLLFVADTGNHCIRRVDLAGRRVERIAGTDEQARRPRRGGPALASLLSSPWDLALGESMGSVGGAAPPDFPHFPCSRLFVAMAGNHQLWAVDLAAGEARRLVGTGREALGDGTLERCALAQPSGLALHAGRLYFADSESSAVRVADMPADRVETLVGAGLFEFGDRDGSGPDARLQHPLGVAYHAGVLYVADTYNHRIKRLDPLTGAAQTFLGTGEAGRRDGPGAQAGFWEPGGLSAAGDRLYIADTNNHAIRVAHLVTGEVTTLEVRSALSQSPRIPSCAIRAGVL